MLTHACRDHSNGLIEADVTIQTCWDADRLDLGRVDIVPQASRLCTAHAREDRFLEAAYERSLGMRIRGGMELRHALAGINRRQVCGQIFSD